MKNNNRLNTTLGELVSEFPPIVPVMNKYKLDYCCGGKDSLGAAIKELKLNKDSVLLDLEKAIEENRINETTVKDWQKESISSIIDFILNTHHVFMKKTLAELNELVFKILKVHYSKNGETLLQVHSLFGKLKTELEAHLVKEEENLFPLILEFEQNKNGELKNQILKIVNETKSEHDGAGDIFKELEKITNGYTAPVDGCGTYKRTFQLLDDLEKDTFNHIHLENTILFGKL